MKVDKKFADNVIQNPLIQVLKTGVVFKKSEGKFHKWEERFFLLCDCGLLYFKRGNDQP